MKNINELGKIEDDSMFEGGDPDDVDNIDFNNYKGIYAEDDAGQKYQCPETGAHFEPKDLCKRIYRIIEKRKPFEIELYGQSMLVDGVGTSLIAKAPYADKAAPTEFNERNSKSANKMQHQVPANARAGSMKTQFQNNGSKLQTEMAAYEDDDQQIRPKVNVGNFK